MSDAIAIINYGCGNVKSVQNAIRHVGGQSDIINRPDELSRYRRAILPGVGAFDHAMGLLLASGLAHSLKKWIESDDNHLLGICVGMQLLCNRSEESVQNTPGLGLINADVKILQSNQNLSLPNIGWGNVEFHGADYKIFSGDYYFVHSYGVFCHDKNNTIASSKYGETTFSSGITNNRNILGYQFHPEKSHKLGLGLLGNFCQL